MVTTFAWKHHPLDLKIGHPLTSIFGIWLESNLARPHRGHFASLVLIYQVNNPLSHTGTSALIGNISPAPTVLTLIADSYIAMWPYLPKGVLYTHSFKTHFSSPSASYINALTAHVFNTAEGWTVCFTQAFFSSLSGIHECLGGLYMPHLPLASRRLTVNHHTTGWWVWPWI